jgi:hypothetical protein
MKQCGCPFTNRATFARANAHGGTHAYAVFDILMDKPMFDYIAKHRLYSVQGQDEFAGPIIFPSGSNPTKDKDAS